jgi:hypothetical protein
MRRHRLLVAMVAALLVACTAGCKEKKLDTTALVSASTLPGAAEVMPAIEKKDYDGAIALLMKMREAVTNDEQNSQLILLSRQARDRLGELGATDDKAREAAQSLRLLQSGR